MNIRRGKIRINPISNGKLKAYVDGKESLEALLRLDGVEEKVKNTDFAAILSACSTERNHDYWNTAWVVILRHSSRAIDVMRFDTEGLPKHEVRLPFPENAAHTEELRLAFLILCSWATEFDRILTIRTSASNEEDRSFLMAKGFRAGEGNEMLFIKPHRTWMPIFLALGAVLGFLLGFLLNSIGLGLGLGLPIGAFWGLYLDEKEKKKLPPKSDSEK